MKNNIWRREGVYYEERNGRRKKKLSRKLRRQKETRITMQKLTLQWKEKETKKKPMTGEKRYKNKRDKERKADRRGKRDTTKESDKENKEDGDEDLNDEKIHKKKTKQKKSTVPAF